MAIICLVMRMWSKQRDTAGFNLNINWHSGGNQMGSSNFAKSRMGCFVSVM